MATITLPDMRDKRGRFRRGAKRAVDAAFLDFRGRFTQQHFKRSAVSRYGGEYRKYGDKLTRNPRRRPLVKTGRLRHAAIAGAVALRGATAVRRLVWTSLPKYTYFNPANAVHKVKALEAVADRETVHFAGRVEKHLTASQNRR